LGSAAFTALALEIKKNNDFNGCNDEMRWQIDHVQPEICGMLQKMPRRTEGKTRLDKIMFELDKELRNK
jgi:hypothetical protein